MAAGWRVTLDEPIVEVIEPGFLRTFHAYDLKGSEKVSAGAWQEPLTGCLMLRPSFLRENWYKPANWKGKSDWNVASSWWEDTYRGNTGAGAASSRFFGSLLTPTPANPYPIVPGYTPSVLNFGAIVGIHLFDVANKDALTMGAQSNFSIARDEGFVFHIHFEVDELHRFRHLLFLQWADIGFHLASDGTLTAIHYPNGATNQGVYLDKFDIGQLGRIHNRDLYIIFLPIPNHGMAVHVSSEGVRANAYTSSLGTGAFLSGHLFKFPPRSDTTGNVYVHDGGPVSLYTLPIDSLPTDAPIRYQFGFHPVRYETSGAFQFVGPVFDFSYQPTQNVTATALKVQDGRGIVSAALLKPNGTDAWATNQTDSRQARVVVNLSTTNALYTPFVFGAQVRANRLTQTRGTVARQITWQKIEFSCDENGNVDGLVEARADTPETHQIFRRGDAPWRLEWTADDSIATPVWETIGGGLAQLMPDARYTIEGSDSTARGVIYGTWQLSGKAARLAEVHTFLDGAFDGETFQVAIDNVLLSAGFDPIASYPPYLQTLRLPAAQAAQNFRFGANPGDSGEDVIQKFLLLARGQNREFRIRYDWGAQAWRIEQKPKYTTDADTWIFTPFQNERGVAVGGVTAGRVLYCHYPERAGQMRIFPPEANVVQCVGMTEPGGGGKSVAGFPFRSADSLSNPASLNYLGRIVAARPLFEELQTTAEVDVMGRRLFDVVSVREEQQDVQLVGFRPLLRPCGSGAASTGPPRVILRAVDAVGNRVNNLTGYMKRLHVLVDSGTCGAEILTATVSTRWEMGLNE